jgi:exodeoxyribonuclease V gamma subunit
VLTVYRSNRAELLAQLLATELRLNPPLPFEPVAVVVNTWPTSRWLGEQLALHLGGVVANLRFPFPGSLLRSLVDRVLEGPGPVEPGPAASPAAAGTTPAGGPTPLPQPPPSAGPGPEADPWRAGLLVWRVLELLPELSGQEEAAPLASWLGDHDLEHRLDRPCWQLARAIADAFDDYGLYRPELLQAWESGASTDERGQPLPTSQCWQPLLYRALRRRLGIAPFGLRVAEAIERLRDPAPLPAIDGGHLRLFGLSSLAPVQVRLLQALSGRMQVDLHLLTPCRDLWQRCEDRRRRLSDALALALPFDADWLLEAPGLDARFGRLGGEFQQLLEGDGATQLGTAREGDLFFLPADVARRQHPDRPAPLLAQLQQQLLETPQHRDQDGNQEDPGHDEADADLGDGLAGDLAEAPEGCPTGRLKRGEGDASLEFHACPGDLRQVQIVRDRLLQLLAADPSLEPRHLLVMTPDVERFAPLVAAVFGDTGATGVDLPWRLTDRSQLNQAGIGRTLLSLLRLGGERLTASALEALLECGPLQRRFGLEAGEAGRLSPWLQQCGFRWGLDAQERHGDATHSLAWVLDRLLLGLVLPDRPGLAPADTAPAPPAGQLDRLGRWLHLLLRLRHWLQELRVSRCCSDWERLVGELLDDLFGDGGDAGWELPPLRKLLAETVQAAGSQDGRLLEAPVLAEVLEEGLSADSGRFGHRSGALTISALEPMRAIPHRVIVLMGLDGGHFPRQRPRPGFHRLEHHRQLGDPHPADQDRYALLEALLSARDHLLITWSCRDDRKGEELPPASPVRQWLEWLEQELGSTAAASLVRRHAASPLARANFQPDAGRPPSSCDRRLLASRRLLDGALPPPATGLRWTLPPPPAAGAEGTCPPGAGERAGNERQDAGALGDALSGAQGGALGSAVGGAVGGACGGASTTGAHGAGATVGGNAIPAAGEETAAAAAWDDLRAWLMAPQKQWLRQLGLRPSEWETIVEDLEPLALEERQRARLLRQALRDRPEAPADAGPDWLNDWRGQGLLPPGSAAVLEARALENRWQSLQTTLAGLGELRRDGLRWGPLLAEVERRGDAVVVVQLGRGQVKAKLDLWLSLLLAVAATPPGEPAPARGVLVARKKKSGKEAELPDDVFDKDLTLVAPERQAAEALLQALIDLRGRWRAACWPVPPATGWAWLEAERKQPGSGLDKTRESWEGAEARFAEREQPEMALCFGADLPVEALLEAPFAALASDLFGPLMDAITVEKTTRAKSGSTRKTRTKAVAEPDIAEPSAKAPITEAQAASAAEDSGPKGGSTPPRRRP